MAKYVLPLSGAALLLGVVAVACGTDVAGIDPQLDGGLPGQDAGKDTGSPDGGSGDDGGTPNPEAKSYLIGGSVSGLHGTGLVLQNNAGDDLTVNADGTFVFKTSVQAGKTFDVTIKNQPTAPSQKCTVSGGTGTVVAADVTTVVVNCATNKFTVGGTVGGLAGTGLVLQNNNGDDITVGGNSFAFPTTIDDGAAYAVTIKTQPSNLEQTCTVANGSGNIAGANVNSVAITCVTKKYTVGGTVVGLAGTGLVLQNNNGDDFTVGPDGNFTFATSLNDGSNFSVSVKTNPSGPAQNCVVTGGSGTIAGGNVASVVVNCATDKFVIGGSVSGLDGSGLVLQNNGGNDRTITSNGDFSFSTLLDDLASYAVTVQAQPTNKWQTCTVTNGSGAVAAANVGDIAIKCVTNEYKVKATVSGLDGTGLVLQNNGGNDLTITGNGTFEFTTAVPSGSGYFVTTLTNPTDKSQTCTVTNGTGTIEGADITDVAVTCVTNHYTVGGNVTGLVGTGLVLQNNGGDDYAVDDNGEFTFDGSLESGQTFAVTVLTPPGSPSQTCTVTGDTGTVTAGNVVSVSVNCSTDSFTAGGLVSGLAGTGLVLQNNGGDDIPVNLNGKFAMSPQLDGSAYNVTVKTQPTANSQTCTVTNSSGNLAGANVANIGVNCVTDTFSVGGNIAGLGGGTVVLTNNGGNDLSMGADGNFTFTTPIASGAAYAVAVKTQPANRTCTVTNGSGTVTNAAVNTVTISCKLSACNAVGDLLWCKDDVAARSCNTFCSALGLGNPTVSDAEWLAAQDTNAECSAIASSFGIGAVTIASYSYACAEARPSNGDLACSSVASCPSAHRTGSDSGGHYAVCPCATARACGTAGEGGVTSVSCPPGTRIKSVQFASYGLPNGSCGSFTTDGACHSNTSQTVVENACIGKSSCSVSAINQVFGDPCVGTGKRLYIQATCE